MIMRKSNAIRSRSPQRISLRLLLRSLRAPFRRARSGREDYGTLWNDGAYGLAFRSEFKYAMRIYFAPLVGVMRVMARVGRFVVQKTLRHQ